MRSDQSNGKLNLTEPAQAPRANAWGLELTEIPEVETPVFNAYLACRSE